MLPTPDDSALVELSPSELADRLFRHLRRLELDSSYNVPAPGESLLPLFHVNVCAIGGGRYIRLRDTRYDSGVRLTFSEALAYLRWLEAGHRGRYSDFAYEHDREDHDGDAFSIE